ncbi:glycosyltransferase [Aquimarina sp. W85]|uniref:glycosyltransferase n=1 Tax=Aquimarina rhodophyticola TaxID=3342246 RepID=UPI003670191D
MIQISVIIPMYNVENYLARCVNSVVLQDLKEEQMEIIMVDDGSPDNSKLVASELASKHTFITVISQKNKGLGGARNTGIQNANGKYLLFLDADDWLLSNKLKYLISIADNDALDILEFGANLVTEDGKIANTISKSCDKVLTGIMYYDKINYAGSACNKLYNTQFLKKNNLFFLEKIYGEDFEFNTRSFFHAIKMKAIGHVCIEFLQSSNSITRNTDISKKKKYLNDYIKILENIRAFQESQNSQKALSTVASNFFIERMTMININAFYMMFKNNFSYNEMLAYKYALIDKKLYYTDFPVKIKKKDLFRKVLIKNFWMFKITQFIKNV